MFVARLWATTIIRFAMDSNFFCHYTVQDCSVPPWLNLRVSSMVLHPMLTTLNNLKQFVFNEMAESTTVSDVKTTFTCLSPVIE